MSTDNIKRVSDGFNKLKKDIDTEFFPKWSLINDWISKFRSNLFDALEKWEEAVRTLIEKNRESIDSLMDTTSGRNSFPYSKRLELQILSNWMWYLHDYITAKEGMVTTLLEKWNINVAEEDKTWVNSCILETLKNKLIESLQSISWVEVTPIWENEKWVLIWWYSPEYKLNIIVQTDSWDTKTVHNCIFFNTVENRWVIESLYPPMP